jgi:hypothetical protein
MSDIFKDKAEARRNAEKFKSMTGREAQDLFKTNRAEYDRLRASSQAVGEIGAPGYAVVSDLPKSRERIYSTEEITARARWSEQDCIRFYRDNTAGDKFTIAALEKVDEVGAKLLRIAAQSFGVIAVTPHVEKKSPLLTPPAEIDPQPRIAIGEALGSKLNLPATYKVGPLELEGLINLAKAKDAAASEKK